MEYKNFFEVCRRGIFFRTSKGTLNLYDLFELPVEELLNIYKKLIIKADELLQIFKDEKWKRGNFTYKTIIEQVL